MVRHLVRESTSYLKVTGRAMKVFCGGIFRRMRYPFAEVILIGLREYRDGDLNRDAWILAAQRDRFGTRLGGFDHRSDHRESAIGGLPLSCRVDLVRLASANGKQYRTLGRK